MLPQFGSEDHDAAGKQVVGFGSTEHNCVIIPDADLPDLKIALVGNTFKAVGRITHIIAAVGKQLAGCLPHGILINQALVIRRDDRQNGLG